MWLLISFTLLFWHKPSFPNATKMKLGIKHAFMSLWMPNQIFYIRNRKVLTCKHFSTGFSAPKTYIYHSVNYFILCYLKITILKINSTKLFQLSLICKHFMKIFVKFCKKKSKKSFFIKFIMTLQWNSQELWKMSCFQRNIDAFTFWCCTSKIGMSYLKGKLLRWKNIRKMLTCKHFLGPIIIKPH